MDTTSKKFHGPKKHNNYAQNSMPPVTKGVEKSHGPNKT